MKIYRRLRTHQARRRRIEERLYKLVLQEIKSGVLKDGLWAKALSKSGGNEKSARSLYISYRVQSLKDDFQDYQDSQSDSSRQSPEMAVENHQSENTPASDPDDFLYVKVFFFGLFFFGILFVLGSILGD